MLNQQIRDLRKTREIINTKMERRANREEIIEEDDIY